MYKLLIIDDNHSFIDSFKVMLKDYSLQYDSSFRFQEAARKIEERRPYINRDSLQKVLEFDREYREWESQKESARKKSGEGAEVLPGQNDIPVAPLLEAPLVNNDGYVMVVVEQDTESSTKGIDFILSIIKNQSGWSENDFLLLTSRLAPVEARARSLGIAVMEKPLKQSLLKQLVASRLKAIMETQARGSDIIQRHGIEVADGSDKKEKKDSNRRKTGKTGS